MDDPDVPAGTQFGHETARHDHERGATVEGSALTAEEPHPEGGVVSSAAETEREVLARVARGDRTGALLAWLLFGGPA